MTTENDETYKNIIGDKGYLFLKSFLPINEVELFENALTKLFLDNCPDSKDIFDASVKLDSENKELLYQLYLIIPKMREFSRLKEYYFKHLEQVFPNKNYIDIGSGVLFGLPQDKRLTWTWHQESNYHPGIESVIHYWAPLFNNSSVSNGAMSVLEGTQALGTLPYTTSKPYENGGTSLIPVNIEKLESEYSEETFVINRGDVACFHKDLIHKSNFNSSSKTRFSLVFRFVAMDTVPKLHEFQNLRAKE